MADPNNPKPSEVLTLLARMGADGKGGVALQPKATEDAIQRMQSDAERDLGEIVPDGYLRLLRLSNGVQINCAYFKEAENLVPENLDVEFDEIIVLGNDGMAEYVYDKRDKRFHIINMGFPDERFSSFDSFEELLIVVMKEQQAI